MEISKKAYAKINLGLDVVGKRDDGYHLVRMIMQTVDIYDTLEFKDNSTGQINLFSASDKIPLDGSNLVCRAAELLKDRYGVEKGVDITLEKRIPVAAGMAGGSTDAAATFLALNELWGLGLGRDKLCEMAVSLGADIPYCIIGGTALAEGIGEVLTPISDMPQCYLVIAKPAIDVSTGWVYKELDSREIAHHPDIDGIRDCIEAGDLRRMCERIENVLEPVTVSKYPVIAGIETVLENSGAVRAFMTGSGPTVFAVFDSRQKAEEGLEAVRESGLAPEMFLSVPIKPADF